MTKEKPGSEERHNRFVNNPIGRVFIPEMVLAKAEKYNKIETHWHPCGAIIASVRDYRKKKENKKGPS
jgi:hypothetical protein